LNFHSGS